MDISKWLPQKLLQGPPLPAFLNIYWPWYKLPVTTFQVSNLIISPEVVNPGQTVTISCMVTNTGSEAGNYTVILGGDFVAERTVSLQLGESKQVAFEVTPSTVKTYQVSVDGQSGSFQVVEPGTEPDTGSLSGFVTDDTTGKPVAEATVAVSIWGTTTDESGYYLLQDIQPVPGSYEVAVLSPDYETKRVNITINPGTNNFNVSIIPLPPPAPSTLVLTTQNMPGNVWSGKIKDIASGQIYSWPIQSVKERIEIPALAGNSIRFSYDMDYGEKSYGPFLIELPSTTGEFVWNGATKKLGSSSVKDLVSTSNKQIIKGVLRDQAVAATFGDRVTLDVTDSLDVSGINAGKLYIGERVDIYVNIPRLIGGFSAFAPGSALECQCTLKNKEFPAPSGPSKVMPVFVGDWIREARTFPNEAYVFSGSASKTDGNLNITISGAITPFRIAVVAFGGVVPVGPTAPGVAVLLTAVKYLQGPVSGAVVAPPGIGSYVVQGYGVFAHPNPGATWDMAYDARNWQRIASLSGPTYGGYA